MGLRWKRKRTTTHWLWLSTDCWSLAAGAASARAQILREQAHEVAIEVAQELTHV